jgi:hypothetical protein
VSSNVEVDAEFALAVCTAGALDAVVFLARTGQNDRRRAKVWRTPRNLRAARTGSTSPQQKTLVNTLAGDQASPKVGLPTPATTRRRALATPHLPPLTPRRRSPGTPVTTRRRALPPLYRRPSTHGRRTARLAAPSGFAHGFCAVPRVFPGAQRKKGGQTQKVSDGVRSPGRPGRLVTTASTRPRVQARHGPQASGRARPPLVGRTGPFSRSTDQRKSLPPKP